MSAAVNAVTGVQAAAAADLRAKALELRASGLTIAQISAQLGRKRGTVYAALRRELQRLGRRRQELGDGLLELELDRMDRMMAVYWAKALDGDLKAAQMVLKISEHRARMAGFNAPVKVEGTLTHYDGKDEETLVAMARARGLPVVEVRQIEGSVSKVETPRDDVIDVEVITDGDASQRPAQ